MSRQDKGGRPSRFSKKLADKVCAYLIEGYSLRQIENEKGMPGKSTICRWLASDNKEFQEQYAHAREVQAEIMLDEIIEIADDGSNDWMEREIKGGLVIEVANAEHISRSRLRVDARKWAMAKLKPKKYGDRTILAGDKDNPIDHNVNFKIDWVSAKDTPPK